MEQRRGDSWRMVHVRLAFMAVSLLFGRAVWAQIRYSVSEEQNDGTVIGNIAKDLGTDARNLRERGFRIVSSSGESLFKVNQNDGALYVSGNLDRETLCEKSTLCTINLKIAMENPLEIHYVTVEIIDVNDHAPVFTEKETLLEIWESTLSGTRFQLQPAHDPDSGSNSIQTYKLSQNDHFRLEVKDRGEGGKIPVLVLQKPIDREVMQSMKMLLTAVDGGRPIKSGTMDIAVRVLDVNDNMPVFTMDVYSVQLNENAPIGTTVIRVNATDLDDGPNGEVVYAFSSSVHGKLRKMFDIDSITGEIAVKAHIDFEAASIYEIDITASDKGTVPLTTDKSVIIKIVDVNDNAPEIELTSLSSYVSEDSRPGTTVALISVTDLDSGINGKVFCSVPEDIPFKLMPSSQDNIYSLVTTSLIDREKQYEYDIELVAKDSGEPSLSSVKHLTILVSDINDNSPEFSLSPYTFYVTENNIPGMPLFCVTASDRDTNENAVVLYEVMKESGDDNKRMFMNINPENGCIYALKSFDFESVKTFNFHVLATDSGTPSLSSNVTVNVFILDQNDNVPVILYPVSANGSAEGVEEIPRNVNAGHLVTKVRAYDADIGYNGWLLFSLQEVSDHSLFGLDRYTGQIRTLRLLTETDEAEHKLVILVKDNGNISLSATATVNIKLVEPKEAFAASDEKNAVKEEKENNVTFYLIITLGSVSFLFIISIIVLIVMQCSKSTDYSSKYLQDTNYDGTLCHSIQYRSGDKRYMLVGPRTSIGSTIVPGSNANTLVIQDCRRRTSGEPKAPNADWRYSASLRAGMQSSVHMEESSVMQGAQGVLVQNWPTVSSAPDNEGGEVSPPVGAGVDSNSWHFRYGPGPGMPPQHLKPGEVPPEAFIIPGSPAIISIRQGQDGDDKSDFITFGKKEEAKKKKKKKKEKEKKDKKEKGKDDDD
ncbi:protocadherin alpha-8-like isoform X8 [Hemibagrus wyckioides]|uniref:protocadherin alpha-8-like isoform X8 n=1 Tax=Hemibagrus wyckioides TaxID=337641 RepID=UPI00266C07F4|nr:protocadherin alpha-8-like isoform X8 [Hemibagrus wyckioides]